MQWKMHPNFVYNITHVGPPLEDKNPHAYRWKNDTMFRTLWAQIDAHIGC